MGLKFGKMLSDMLNRLDEAYLDLEPFQLLYIDTRPAQVTLILVVLLVASSIEQ